MGAVLRAATAADVPEILRLVRGLAEYEREPNAVEATEELYRRHLFPAAAPPVAYAEVAELDGRLVGLALWFPTFSTFLGRPGIWLEDLFVRPAHRGRGHGLALLATLRSMTDGRVEWAVLDWNEPSIAFYRALGAEPVAGWTRYRWT